MLHLLGALTLSTTLLMAEAQNNELKEVLKIGQESSSLLAKTLGKNMKEHMKAGGPMDALNFCSTEAYDLTDSVNKKLKSNTKVKRISSKTRSAANHPNKEEQSVLSLLETMQEQGVILPEYLIQKSGEKQYKYYKPIIIDNGVCLKCHGDVKDEKLKNTIAARYPQDKALGYKMNELRGAIVVDITTK